MLPCSIVGLLPHPLHPLQLRYHWNDLPCDADLYECSDCYHMDPDDLVDVTLKLVFLKSLVYIELGNVEHN